MKAESLAARFLHGDVSRRDFLKRAVASVPACSRRPAWGRWRMLQVERYPPHSPQRQRAAGRSYPAARCKAALTGEPDTLDPATSTIYTGAQVYDNIFSKLIDLD